MISQRSGRSLLFLAVAANLLVIAACFAVLGWNTAGAGSATRNTARLASVFFVIGFAAPGLRRWLPTIRETDWLRAFMAAQFVHFGSVAVLHLRFLNDIHAAPPLQVAGFVLLGFLLVAAVGVLAGRRSGLARAVCLVAMHVVFLIFALDYARHPIHPLRAMAAVYFAVLVVRYIAPKQQAMRAAGK